MKESNIIENSISETMTKASTISSEEYPKVYLYKRIVQAKRFIDTNYAKNIDIDNIAREASFSKFHFIRIFKKAYGKAPHKYLTSVRIEKAVILLRAGKPVSEVCLAVGFESLSSFSGLFKNTIGLSPSTFLIQHHRLKTEISKVPFRFIPSCYAYQNGWIENSNFEEAIV